MDEIRREKIQILAQEILNFSRQRILVNMRFLEPALNTFEEKPVEHFAGDRCAGDKMSAYEEKPGMGTDGRFLYYDPMYVLKVYQKEKGTVSRVYLHLILHGIFRHFYVSPVVEHDRWDLACDMAAEYLIESWKLDFVKTSRELEEKRELERIRKLTGFMNAERIYRYLKGQDTSEIKRLEKIFRIDDHSGWYPKKQNIKMVQSYDMKNGQNICCQELEKMWKQISQKIQVDLETFMRSRSSEAGDFLMNLKLSNRKKQDYSAFLRKFSKLGECMKINDEEFDYNFYTYGLKLYGNMPLIEPLEYKDICIVKNFVVVIDTSGSVEEEQLRKFLEKTYQILSSQQDNRIRVNFHLIQCDAKVQQDVEITTLDELEQFMDELVLWGRGGTDFRPAFEYIEELRRKGGLSNLNGVIYFTDGMGVYPVKKPDYPVAFVFDSVTLDDIPKVPAWAIRYLLDAI